MDQIQSEEEDEGEGEKNVDDDDDDGLYALCKREVTFLNGSVSCKIEIYSIS